MSKICYRKATRTSRRTETTTSRITSYQLTPLTLSPTVSTITNGLATITTTIPSRVVTSRVPAATLTVYGYATYVTTFYTTSCTSATGVVQSGYTPFDPSDPTTFGNSESNPLSTGAIVGVVLGSLVGALLIGILIYFFWRSRKAKAQRNNIQYPVSSMSQYSPPQGGQDLRFSQSYGQPYMPVQVGTPYALPVNTPPFQQHHFEPQSPHGYQPPETSALNDRGIPLGQSPVMAIVNRSTTSASSSEPRAALLPSSTAALDGHTPGSHSQSISSHPSPSPPIGADLYSLPTLDPQGSASNPNISLIHQPQRQQSSSSGV